jgi:hypothetical protein
MVKALGNVVYSIPRGAKGIFLELSQLRCRFLAFITTSILEIIYTYPSTHVIPMTLIEVVRDFEETRQ